ncbi:MAG: IclR family transcriptional regulator [Saprospiraceae bacterium]|nr:IclR family transcriptional regulator [Saprospiraceae bacterium]
MDGQNIIKSLDKGLRMLEIIGRSDSPLTSSDLGKMLGINRSSAFRLLNTLKQRGFVVNSANSKALVLGPSIRALASDNTWLYTLSQVARRHLQRLADMTGETAHIAVLEGHHTLIIDNEMSPRSIGVNVQKGDIGLIYCTAVGKALLLDHSKADLQKLLGRSLLLPRTPHTKTSLEELISELLASQSRGYVLDDEEYLMGVRCIGSAIRDASGRIVASVGISAPLERLLPDQYDQVGAMVRLAADWISEELRGNGRPMADPGYSTSSNLRSSDQSIK